MTSKLTGNISDLSEARKKLLQKRLRGEQISTTQKIDHSAIQRREDVHWADLSMSQHRLWIFEQINQGTTIYNLPSVVRLKGILQIAALKASIQLIMKRHEALRTSFRLENDQPIQVIANDIELDMPVHDLSKIEDPATEASKLIDLDISKPFNLFAGPLLRVSLIKLSHDDHILLMNMHHIISDGWSMGIFMRELTDYYKGALADKQVEIKDLPIQYGDFAQWQIEHLQAERLQKQLAYWVEKLKNTPILQLPTDNPRPALQSFNGARYYFELPGSFFERVHQFSRQQGVTTFMTLVTALKVLLYRYTGQTDISIGTPIANRNRVELESLIGCFINTLVLRTELDEQQSFKECLAKVAQTTYEAFANQEVPFEKLIQSTSYQRDLSFPPLFQVLFVYQNTPIELLDFEDLEVEQLSIKTNTAMFDITLSLEDQKHGGKCFFEYNTDLFSPETLERMAGHFLKILEEVTLQAEQAIATLPILTAEEYFELLHMSSLPNPTDSGTFHQMFEEQVQRNPNAVALSFEQQWLTYQQLNQKANQVARFLRKHGVARDVLVGISCERSLEMIIGLLGILKAGGTYLPMDPTYPPDRLSYMVEDSKIKLMLTQKHLQVEYAGVRAVYLDDCSNFADEDIDNLLLEIQPNQLAYVIYTSGSTGKPKGVMVEHKGLCNVVKQQKKLFDVQEKSRVLQFASLSFDASIFEIMMALGNGATLYLGQKDSLRGEAIIEFLKRCQITHATLPPSILAQLSEQGLPELQTIVTAGEACTEEVIRRWTKGRSLYNAYGPTEATIWSTTTKCQVGRRASIIGRPINNVQVYLLDKNLQPVPKGVIGEVFIGGVSLARGYLHRDDLSREKFIQHPFSEEKHDKLYRTGDLARLLSNGEIDFLGRVDHQVKVRGHRIELGEVEGVLNQLEGVKECVVVARDDLASSTQLVGYYTLLEQDQTHSLELLSQLKNKLPDYMVPAHLVKLPEMPLTPNGKIDRKALPAPDMERGRDQEFHAPQKPEEQILAQIWSDVLGVKSIGIKDNFFELGGDSILSIQIVARAKQEGIHITSKQIFEQQCIEQLVNVVGNRVSRSQESEITAGEVSLTPIQQWFFEFQSKDVHHWNQSVLLKSFKQLEPEIVQQATKALLEHHDSLRLRYIQQHDVWKQVYGAIDENIPYERLHTSDMKEDEIASLIEAKATEVQASLHLSEGPLFKVIHFDFGAQEAHRILFLAHHLVVDALSWRILLEDFQQLYTQLEAGKPANLPPKTSSFAWWSKQLEEYAHSAEILTDLEYWKEKKEKYVVHSLINEADEQKNIVETEQTVHAELSQEETEALLNKTKEGRISINHLLLAALGLACYDWDLHQVLAVDLESHGREEIFDELDVSRTVGWFTSKYPVYFEMNPRANLAQNIALVKENIRSIPNNGLGYGLLKYLSNDAKIRAQMNALPLPQIALNYLGQFDQLFAAATLFAQGREPVGPQRSLKGRRTHVFEINAHVSEGRFQVAWTYSAALHTHEQVERLITLFMTKMKDFVQHVSLEELRNDSNLALVDFNWEQEDINQALAAIKKTLEAQHNDE